VMTAGAVAVALGSAVARSMAGSPVNVGGLFAVLAKANVFRPVLSLWLCR
jgi:hypothetical protein